MKTYEMIALADENGKRYKMGDMYYQNEKKTECECYENLLNAVILLAMQDYKKALKIYKRNIELSLKTNENINAIRRSKIEINSIENWFYSDVFSYYTKINPDIFIRKIREEVYGKGSEEIERVRFFKTSKSIKNKDTQQRT